MYDIFYVGSEDDNWINLKNKYPNSLIVDPNTDIYQLKKKSFTKMFWVIWNDVVLTDNFNLNEYRATKWDEHFVHIFKNTEYYDGICLIPKNITISDQEFKTRCFQDKKEINIIVSSPTIYDKFCIESYDDYLKALDNTTTEMFWALWPEIEITDESVFDVYFSHHDKYNRSENHAWQHKFRKDEVTFGGLHLMCKNKPVSKKEIDFRFLINKKEHNEIVSKHRIYDIVFISYDEPNADANYKILQQRFPKAKRIHGVKGIHQAHIDAAKLCDTEMFWVVDGDSELLPSFDFSHAVNRYDLDLVHIYQSINPINGLVYGYGGVKLLPTKLTIDMNINAADMTTSISSKIKVMKEISNITAYNTDPFNTWKSAFRECAKLASKVIDRQKDDETDERLQTWLSKGHNKKFGEYAIRGARAGMEFVLSNKSDISLINNFDWLKEQFEIHEKH